MADQQQHHTRQTRSAVVRVETAAVVGSVEEHLDGRPAARGVTIDGPTTREIDDAFWLERAPHGGYQLQVSIADVGSWITPDQTPTLDQTAYRRAFTRYAANWYQPMLPRLLAEDRLSLLEGQARPTITLTIPLDAHCSPGEPQIAQTVLRSGKQLSYETAERELEQAENDLGSMLQLAHEVAQGLLQARRLRGALAIYDLPTGWMTTEEGFLRRLGVEDQYQVQLITAEFMILANQAAAHFLATRGIPALYRNQKATAIAPERPSLLQMLDTVVSHPTFSSPERVSATFQLALERATYAPTLAGHYGLNLPAYLHITSPLRRYPDLVNQRMLLAVLREDSLPSSRAALEDIAASINGREQGAREAKRAHFLSLYDRRVGVLVAAATRDPSAEIGALARLDARKFHSVLRIAAEGQALFPPVEQEILRRLETRQLYAHDLFTLLFRFPTRGAAWERVKTAALRQLQRTPEYASNLLLMGANALAWSSPSYETLPGEGEFAPLFRVRATITRAGQQYASAWQSAPQKQRAKHLAATNLILQLASGAQQAEPLDVEDGSLASMPDDSSRQPTSAPASPRPGEPARPNYKGQLNDQMQARQWERPVYVVRCQSGLPHAPLFVVEGKTSIGGNACTAQGEGRTRIEAEQHAAQQLLSLLAQMPSQEAPPALSSDKPTAMSALNELQQKAVIEAVTYSYEQQGQPHDGSFRCTCTVTAADGRTVESSGVGKTKKQAAQDAAAQALAHLTAGENGESEQEVQR